jgi:hypothetical protein
MTASLCRQPASLYNNKQRKLRTDSQISYLNTDFEQNSSDDVIKIGNYLKSQHDHQIMSVHKSHLVQLCKLSLSALQFKRHVVHLNQNQNATHNG